MADHFFDAKVCDRCGNSLSGGRIMSMFNEDVICMDCKRKEQRMPEYAHARDEERRQVAMGNRNFKGIGYPSRHI